jgi:hypothetical protein
MRHAIRALLLINCLAALSAAPALTQTSFSQATAEASTAAPVAYVYVGTGNGVNLYYAAANGKLTLASGSPFHVIGSLWGSNGKHLITMDNINSIYSYAVLKGGVIGAQESSINTQDYLGSNCGETEQANLDHTGQNVYVLLNVGGDDCAAYQSYNIAETTGELTFNDTVMHPNGGLWHVMPVFTQNDKFAYSLEAEGYGNWSQLRGYIRKSNGGLEKLNFHETDPGPQTGWQFWPDTITEDPAEHLAIGVVPYDPATKTGDHIQLASYSVDSAGNIVSTNTWKNMPTPDISPSSLVMSPSGKLLAVVGNQGYFPWGGSGFTPDGLEVFHFNGAEPITPFSGVLTTSAIDWTRWDKSNHLYAFASGGTTLFVYTVTPTSIAEAPGSPHTIASAGGPTGGMLVVSVLPWM